MRKKKMYLATGVTLAFACVWLVVFSDRFRGGQAGAQAETAEAVLASGRDVYASIRTMAPLDAPDQIRSALQHMTFEGEARRIDTARRQRLLDELADFFVNRFTADDARKYVDWRLSQGYAWRDLEDMDRQWSIREAHEVVFSEPWKDGDDKRARAFLRFAEHSLKRGDGLNRPVAIAAEARGLVTRFDTLTAVYHSVGMLEGELGTKYWHGVNAATMRGWFKWKRTPEDTMKRQRRLDAALSGVVVEYADGSRRPILFEHWWDPIDRAWVLRRVSVMNFRHRNLSTMEF